MPVIEPRPLIAALLIAVSTAAFGQSETATPDLAQLKAKFLEEMRKEISPAGQQYIAELKKLERKFAIAENFEAAIAARDEGAAVANFLSNKSGKSPAELTAVVDPKDPKPAVEPGTKPDGKKFVNTAASVSDGAEFGDSGLDLSAPKASASWNLGSSEPGGYEVFVNYTSSSATTVQAKESFFRLSGDLPSSGGGMKRVSLGTLKITGRSDTISLIHTGEAKTSSLVIHSIELISTKD